MTEKRDLRARHPALLEAINAVKAANAELAAVAAAVQAECPHNIVAYRDSIEYGNVRVCFTCGLFEEGTPWSSVSGHWSRNDHKPAALGNEDHRVLVSMRQDIFALRVAP
jgi:hypothetical protein